jgi:multiple sugar transport system permease protein
VVHVLRKLYGDMTRNAFAYRMLIPYVVFLALLVLYPIIANFVISLQADGLWTLKNYQQVFKEPVFAKVAFNTVIWTVGSVVLQLLVGFVLALLLNQDFRGRAFFRSIILVLPWATPDIVVGVAWQWMYNDMYGVLNDILFRLGIIDYYLPWLADQDLARLAVIIANTWKGFALSAMFYLAALQTVPHELYEASEVDGANVFQKFLNVTWPILRPFVVTTTMLTTIWTINYFPLIFTMTGGGPANATDTFVTYAYRTAFRFLDFNRSAAMSSFTFVLVFLISLLYLRALSRKEAER